MKLDTKKIKEESERKRDRDRDRERERKENKTEREKEWVRDKKREKIDGSWLYLPNLH